MQLRRRILKSLGLIWNLLVSLRFCWFCFVGEHISFLGETPPIFDGDSFGFFGDILLFLGANGFCCELFDFDLSAVSSFLFFLEL